MNGRLRVPLIAVAMLAGMLLLAGSAEAGGAPQEGPNAISSGELVDAPDLYDGETIVFQGEAIGEAMHRADGSWLHINDDAYYLSNVEEGADLGGYNTGMPVYLPREQAEKVRVFGDYRHEGDVVEVRGTYHAACAQHGGDTDIHATELEIITGGHEVIDPVSPSKTWTAALLSVLAALVFGAYRLVNRPKRV